jgi:hypothetical protein
VAAVNTFWFTKGGKNLVEAEIGWLSSPINVALLKAGFVFDQDGPETWTDLAANEAVGAGYAAGGLALANKSVLLDAASNETRLIADQVQWAASTITARGAAIYANVGTKPLLGFVDFATDRASDLGLFTIQWPATGVLRLRAL